MGLLRYEEVPRIIKRENILINDNLGFDDKSLPKFRKAAITTISPIIAFVWPNTNM